MACATPSSSHEAVTSSAAARAIGEALPTAMPSPAARSSGNVVVAERHHLIGRDVQRITQHMHGRVLTRACRYNLQIFVLGAHKRHRQVLCLQYRNHFVNLRFLAHAEQLVRACIAPVCKQRLQRRDGRLYAGYLCLCAAPFILGGNEPVEVAVNAQMDVPRLRFVQDGPCAFTGQAAVRQPFFIREDESAAAARQRAIHAERISDGKHCTRRTGAHQADNHAVLRRRLHSLAVGGRQLVRGIQKRAVNIHAQQPILLLIHRFFPLCLFRRRQNIGDIAVSVADAQSNHSRADRAH